MVDQGCLEVAAVGGQDSLVGGKMRHARTDLERDVGRAGRLVGRYVDGGDLL